MNNSEEISNTFFIHSFIVISTLILILGTVFAINLIRILGNILITGGTSDSLVINIVGITCAFIMPYCFRIIKSLQILEIVESNGSKLLLHPPIFVNDVNHPTEIKLSQVTNISRDSILNNLVEFTFVENGDEKQIYSFIEKGKLDLIKETITY